jgi:hypothetical protein
VEDHVYRRHRKTFPVSSSGHLTGVIATAGLARCPRGDRRRDNPDCGPITMVPTARQGNALQLWAMSWSTSSFLICRAGLSSWALIQLITAGV